MYMYVHVHVRTCIWCILYYVAVTVCVNRNNMKMENVSGVLSRCRFSVPANIHVRVSQYKS